MTRLRAAAAAFPTFRVPGRAVPLVLPEPAAGLDRGVVLLAMIAAPPLWWSMQLLGLPDIGDPFDVAAFRAFTIPDDRNAFVLYRQAADRLKPWDASEGRAAEDRPDALPGRRPTRSPPMGRGEPRGDGPLPPGDRAARCARPGPAVGSDEAGSMFRRSAPSTCWPCSRRRGWRSRATWPGPGAGTARPSGPPPRRYARYGSIRRMIVQRWHSELAGPVDDVGRRPEDDPAMLRQALDDVVACEALAPSDTVHAQGRVYLRWTGRSTTRKTRASELRRS